jgi:hypothetical protein
MLHFLLGRHFRVFLAFSSAIGLAQRTYFDKPNTLNFLRCIFQ